MTRSDLCMGACLALFASSASVALAGSDAPSKTMAGASLPEAALRTLGQNYADIALAECVAAAYEFDDRVATDVLASAAGFDVFSNYFLESDGERIAALVKDTLAKRYHSIEGPSVRLDFTKCIDMYHGPELAAQVRSLGEWGDKTYEDVEREENKQLERGDGAK